MLDPGTSRGSVVEAGIFDRRADVAGKILFRTQISRVIKALASGVDCPRLKWLPSSGECGQLSTWHCIRRVSVQFGPRKPIRYRIYDPSLCYIANTTEGFLYRYSAIQFRYGTVLPQARKARANRERGKQNAPQLAPSLFSVFSSFLQPMKQKSTRETGVVLHYTNPFVLWISFSALTAHESATSLLTIF